MAKKHIKLLQQNGTETNVSSTLITKLYTLYDLAQRSSDVWDCDENSIKGSFNTTYTYDKYKTELENMFPNLHINVQGYYVYFVDKNVESKIINELVHLIYPDKNYEGVISDLELNNSGRDTLMGFRGIFYNDQNIQTFDELSKLENVKALGWQDFRDCHSLTSIDLTNIKHFSNNSLRSAYNLEYFNGQNSERGSLRLPNCNSDGLAQTNVFYCYEDTTTHTFRGPKIKYIYDLGNCSIIGAYCFTQNTVLEYISESVLSKLTAINTAAFFKCENLVIEDFNAPLLTLIQKDAFHKVKIQKISALGSNCEVGPFAFNECTQLSTISEEALLNIGKLGEAAFQSCDLSNVNDLNLPNLTSIGVNAFKNTKIKTISNLGNITSVTGFEGCTQLTSVILPNICNTLNRSAFSNCTSLRNINISNIKYFDRWCLQQCHLDPILYLSKCEVIAYSSFNLTNITSLYAPNMAHTNGIDYNMVPAGGRSNDMFYPSESMSIVYLKNINKINGGFFGGSSYGHMFTLNITNEYYHNVNGKTLYEYQGEPPFWKTNLDLWAQQDKHYANIKYLVINKQQPPEYWNSFMKYGSSYYGHWSLYQRNETGSETFTYLCVPRSAIETYKSWTAFNPQYTNTTDLSSSDISFLHTITDFDVNTRIIAIESMGHFATKAQYDAAPDKPDGVHNKDEYLIEEYMDISSGEITWDTTPTWSA